MLILLEPFPCPFIKSKRWIFVLSVVHEAFAAAPYVFSLQLLPVWCILTTVGVSVEVAIAVVALEKAIVASFAV